MCTTNRCWYRGLPLLACLPDHGDESPRYCPECSSTNGTTYIYIYNVPLLNNKQPRTELLPPQRTLPPVTALPAPAKPHPTSTPLPNPNPNPNPLLASFLDTAFRSYAERIQAELAALRTACARALCREQQDTARWRRHCAAFKRERDVARERVRALIGEREARAAGSKRPREDEPDQAQEQEQARAGSRDSTPSSTTVTAVADDDDDDAGTACPSPPYVPLVLDCDPAAAPAPPQRSKSADPVLYAPAPPPTRDTTAFDVTVTAPPGGARHIRPEPAPALKRRRKDEPPTSPPPGVELAHVDLMYVPVNGRLACRACLCVAPPSPSPSLSRC